MENDTLSLVIDDEGFVISIDGTKLSQRRPLLVERFKRVTVLQSDQTDSSSSEPNDLRGKLASGAPWW